MRQIRQATRTRSGLFAALLFCTLLVRAIVPAGWMTVADPAGGMTLSICTGMGAAEMVLAPDGTLHEKAPAHGNGGDHPCAFAGAVAPLASLAPALIAPVAPVTTPGAPAVRVVTIGHGLAAPPPWQTGPPALI